MQVIIKWMTVYYAFLEYVFLVLQVREWWTYKITSPCYCSRHSSRQFYIIKIKTKSARQNFVMSAPIYMSLCKRTTSSRITSLELVTPKRQGLAYLMTMSNIIINAHTFWNFICTYLLYASLFNIEKCMNKKVSAFYLHQILIIVISLDLKKWVFY